MKCRLKKKTPNILHSAGDLAVEPVTKAVPGDGGDRVTSEAVIGIIADSAVTASIETLEAVTEPEQVVIPDTDPDPVIVLNEPTIDIYHANETDAKQHDGNNAPVFIDPCQGGPNPFDDGSPTEIDEHSSDEFIGDGDRPGEGLHF